MGPWLKEDLVFGDFEGYFGVNSKIRMIITSTGLCGSKNFYQGSAWEKSEASMVEEHFSSSSVR